MKIGGEAGARLSLEGLSVADAFGQNSFRVGGRPGEMRAGYWDWTDDTHQALSVVEVLLAHGAIEQGALAAAFARRFAEDPMRGYAMGAAGLLHRIANGADWRVEAPALFQGTGSYGNGSAMRAPPIGGFFAGDPDRAAAEAETSAVVTHAHPEAAAGAIAAAVAASLAATDVPPRGDSFVGAVARATPESETRCEILKTLGRSPVEVFEVAEEVGSGWQVTCQDTVPFCVWIAAHHLDDYEIALRQTILGLGDVDTTCAIVGGIVALGGSKIPREWLSKREPLPAGFGAVR